MKEVANFLNLSEQSLEFIFGIIIVFAFFMLLSFFGDNEK